MKSYHQYCSVARALDVVGDRWVLLVVRELLALGPSRYSDLKRGLPGIASNLLAERLKTMEAEGLVARRYAPAPIDAHLYELTDRGRGLDDVLRSLARWGLPSMSSGPAAGDAVQAQWSALFAGLTLTGALSHGDRLTLRIDTGDDAVRVVLRHDGFEVDRAIDGGADVSLVGSAHVVGGLLSGLLTISEAVDLGLRVDGRAHLLVRVLDSSRVHQGVTP